MSSFPQVFIIPVASRGKNPGCRPRLSVMIYMYHVHYQNGFKYWSVIEYALIITWVIQYIIKEDTYINVIISYNGYTLYYTLSTTNAWAHCQDSLHYILKICDDQRNAQAY